MTETELERLVIRLVGDVSAYAKMLLQAQVLTAKAAAVITKLGKQIQGFGKSMAQAGRNMTIALTLPIGFFAKKSVEAFRQFDLAMTETFAKMGRVAPHIRKEMEELAKSMSMSGSTTFSPIELAKGYEALASAGLDAATSMKTLPAVARFAQAGAFDLNLAVKLIVGSMSAFGEMSRDPVIFAKNLEHFSDVIVSVANETTTGVEEVARAMSADAAVAAKQYGMSLEELGAILGVFAMQNKDAEEAGNLTGRAIRLMTDTFTRKRAVWEAMGIQLVDKATGNWIKFSDAIGLLEHAFTGMTGPQRVATLMQMGFKTLTLKAILPLIGMSDELRRQARMYEWVGATADMAKIQSESFSAQMKTMWNTIQVLDIELGEVLAPLLLKLGEHVKALAEYWRGLSDATKQNILIAVGLVAVIGPLLLALGSLIWAVGTIMAAFNSMRVALLLTLGVIGSIPGLIAMIPGAIITVAAACLYLVDALVALATSLTVLSGLLIVLVTLLAIKFIVTPFAEWLWGVNEFNDALKKTIELNNQLNAQMARRNTGEVTDLMGIKDPEKKFDAVKKAIEVAKRNVDGYKASMKGAQKELDRLNTTWNWMLGVKRLKLENEEMADLKKKSEAAQAHLANLQQIMQGLKPAAGPGLAEKDPIETELETGTTDLITELEDKIKFFGMSKEAIDLEKLSLLGLDEATYNHIASLIEQNAALEAQAKLNKDIADLNESLQEKIATFGMTANQIELYKLSIQGANWAQLMFTASLFGQLKAMEDYQKLVDKAANLTEKYMSEEDKLAKTKAELDELLKNNLITLETYTAALEDAQVQTKKDYDVHSHFSISGIEAVAAGSAEALSRINEYRKGMSITPMSGNYGATMPGQFNPGKAQPAPIPVKPVAPSKPVEQDKIASLLGKLVILAQNEAKRPLVALSPSNFEG